MSHRAQGLRAGEPVRPLDEMDYAIAGTSTDMLDVAFSDWQPYVPPRGFHFTGPTSGRGMMTISAGINDSSGTDRLLLSFEVRVGTRNGARHVFPNQAFSGPPVTDSSAQFGCRMVPVEGLNPGVTYFAQVMIAATGAAGTADCRAVNLIWLPCA